MLIKQATMAAEVQVLGCLGRMTVFLLMVLSKNINFPRKATQLEVVEVLIWFIPHLGTPHLTLIHVLRHVPTRTSA